MKLCINCDDFGLSTAINEGTLAAIDKGVVTSCSVMAHHATSHDLNQLRTRGVSIGLHVSLTGLSPYCLASSPKKLVFNIITGKITDSEITAEIERQCHMLQALGDGRISHIDTHEHVHILPAIHRHLVRYANRSNIRHVRIPWEYSRRWSLKKAILNLGFSGRRAGNVRFWGSGFMAEAFTEHNILRQLDYLEKQNIGASIWMVHVGFAAKNRNNDRYGRYRAQELSVLLNIAEKIQKRCHLVPLNELYDDSN